jgi:hypothetical protein
LYLQFCKLCKILHNWFLLFLICLRVTLEESIFVWIHNLHGDKTIEFKTKPVQFSFWQYTLLTSSKVALYPFLLSQSQTVAPYYPQYTLVEITTLLHCSLIPYFNRSSLKSSNCNLKFTNYWLESSIYMTYHSAYLLETP